jgi:hypothetical protein
LVEKGPDALPSPSFLLLLLLLLFLLVASFVLQVILAPVELFGLSVAC